MITILLTILKVLGILLLILLSALILLILLVLFVPVRYRVRLCRKAEDGIPITIDLKVTWLMHLINASFSYPKAAFLKVRLLCFTVFRSDKKKTASAPSEKKKKHKEIKTENQTDEGMTTPQKTAPEPKPPKYRSGPENTESTENAEKANAAEDAKEETKKETQGTVFSKIRRGLERCKEFFQKLLSLFQNIRYTITRICDKIKHIVNHIQYYMKILKSDTFSRAWTVCSGQALSLLKSILPGKFTGSLVIGTGDPAGTGQVLAAYGMLYPLLGNHINVTPDFERQIIEGELFIKGKITIFKGLKTAWKIYFNRDLRRVIQLFKREAA